MEIAMSNTPFIANHPLIQHKVTLLRNKTTGSKQFRELISEITELMVYEATRDLPLCEVEVETPITVTKSSVLAGRKLAFVPIRGPGWAWWTGRWPWCPRRGWGISACTGIPRPCTGGILLQAAGGYRRPGGHRAGSDAGHRRLAVDAISQIKQRHPKSVKFMCIIAAPEGLKALTEAHPDVQVYCASLDEQLNDHGYIVPGLGDAAIGFSAPNKIHRPRKTDKPPFRGIVFVRYFRAGNSRWLDKIKETAWTRR